MSVQNKGSVFCRTTDKRLVKHVLNSNASPSNWVPMDVTQVECKLMEVRKYSADYHKIDVLFRKPNLELISLYTVQNPFLYGCYTLRKEQMKMQLLEVSPSPVKEKSFFYPTTFDSLEAVVRNGFVPAADGAITFYADSQTADQKSGRDDNPRIMIVAKVLISICHVLPELHYIRKNREWNKVDTFADEDKSRFFKTHLNEAYPSAVLVYRDKSGTADGRTSRLIDVKKGCLVSYRAGTRYNPEESSFVNLKKAAKSSQFDKARKMKKREQSDSKETTVKKISTKNGGSDDDDDGFHPDKVAALVHAESKGNGNNDRKNYADTGAIPKRLAPQRNCTRSDAKIVVES